MGVLDKQRSTEEDDGIHDKEPYDKDRIPTPNPKELMAPYHCHSNPPISTALRSYHLCDQLAETIDRSLDLSEFVFGSAPACCGLLELS